MTTLYIMGPKIYNFKWWLYLLTTKYYMKVIPSSYWIILELKRQRRRNLVNLDSISTTDAVVLSPAPFCVPRSRKSTCSCTHATTARVRWINSITVEDPNGRLNTLWFWYRPRNYVLGWCSNSILLSYSEKGVSFLWH